MNPNVDLLREARVKLLEFIYSAYLLEERPEFEKIIEKLELINIK